VDLVKFEPDSDAPVMNLPVWYSDPAPRAKVSD
jgi:hypothetical protein